MNTLLNASPIHIGAVLFEGFEFLDFYGPLELFGLLEDQARITVTAAKTDPIASSYAPCGVAEARVRVRSRRDRSARETGQLRGR